MGLDAVEIVLRTEEFFVITIQDEEAAAVRTVGDFYLLICAKLDVLPLLTPITLQRFQSLQRKKRRCYFSTNTRHYDHHIKFYPGRRKVFGIVSLLS